jgi:hypothetical protein
MVPTACVNTSFNLRGKMSKKRGSAYYGKRIENEFPALHVDVLSGKKTVRQASIAAGLRRQPTRADAIIGNLKKASRADIAQVRVWLRAHRSTKKVPLAAIVDPSGILLPAVIVFIKDWLRKAGRKSPGYLLSKIGAHSNHDYRMSQALKGDKLPPEFLADLDGWLRRNGYV